MAYIILRKLEGGELLRIASFDDLSEAQRLAEAWPDLLVVRAHDEPRPVRTPVAGVHRTHGLLAAPPSRLTPVDEGGGHIHADRPGGRAQEGRLDHLALAGAVADAQRGQDPDQERQTGRVVPLPRARVVGRIAGLSTISRQS